MHIVVFDCAMKIKNIFVNFCVTFMQDDKAERQKTERHRDLLLPNACSRWDWARVKAETRKSV